MPGIVFSNLEPLKHVTITPRGKEIDLEDEIGMSLSIPSGAVTKDVKIEIAAGFAGTWKIPEGMEPVSPAYIINTKNAVFSKDIEVKLQHVANLETSKDCKNMVVVKASSTPTYDGGTSGPVYKFEELKGVKVEYDQGNRNFAVMKIRSFSILKVLRRISQGLIKCEFGQ